MGSASSGSPEQSIPTGHLGHPLKGCVPLVPLPGQETSGQMSRMSWLSRFLPHISETIGPPSTQRKRIVAGPPPAPVHEKEIDQDRPFQPPSNRNFALPTAFQPLFQQPSNHLPSGCVPTPYPPRLEAAFRALTAPRRLPCQTQRRNVNDQHCEARWVDDRDQPNSQRKARDRKSAPKGASSRAIAADAWKQTRRATRMAGSYGTSCSDILIFARPVSPSFEVSAEKAAASQTRSFSPRTRAIPRTRG
jgi:hypothetical protein